MVWLEVLYKFGESGDLYDRKRLVIQCDAFHDFLTDDFRPGMVLLFVCFYSVASLSDNWVCLFGATCPCCSISLLCCTNAVCVSEWFFLRWEIKLEVLKDAANRKFSIQMRHCEIIRNHRHNLALSRQACEPASKAACCCYASRRGLMRLSVVHR